MDDNKPLDKRKTILRFVAFLAFFAMAVTFITLGITNMGRKEAGLQTITAPLDESVPYYEVGVDFQYLFSGSSGDIKLAANTLTAAYTEDLKDVYRLLDPVNTYDNGPNLATLNQSLGREVEIPKELWQVLKDAEAKTRAGKGFNLFAGALYTELDGIRYLLEPRDFDPLRSSDEAERIRRLAEAAGDLSNFNLEFLDEAAGTVRLTVSPAYEKLAAELELEDTPVLSLNLLADAYKLQLLADRLEARGYDKGYLSAQSGLTLALSAYEGGEYCFYGQGEKGVSPAAALPVTPGLRVAQLRAFGLEEEAGYYTLDLDGQTLLRHPWVPADGTYREVLTSALVWSDGISAPDLMLRALDLYAAETPEAAKTAAAGLTDCAAALLLREDPKTVWLTSDAAHALENYGYASARIS